MANSRYEYVKSYEFEDEIFLPNLIVVRIYGHDFRRFAEEHEFENPNDVQAWTLMNKCAKKVLKKFPDIVFSYGFSDEYSFVFKKASKFYNRRASKIESVIVSFFSSVYVIKWRKPFPDKELRYPASFRAKVISFGAIEVLQSYLLWRQNDYHTNNLWNTCQWELIKSGKTEREALELLEGTSKEEKNNLLFEKFEINYQNLIFSDVHEFVKPNDELALNLMNECAKAVFFEKEFQDTVFAYGVSDEYSFVLKKDSQLYQRRASEIVSVILSLFTSMYTMKWKDVFLKKDLKSPPYFDGRAVCYPSSEILRDYLAWRQVDCHINNQYNTCFWQLVKSGKSKREAQNSPKGTRAADKDKLLKQFGIEYSDLPVMFRQGSSTFRKKGGRCRRALQYYRSKFLVRTPNNS